MVKINVETFKKDGFSYEEIESIKRWLKDIEDWNTIPYDVVKKNSREKIFSKQKSYV